MRVRMGERLRMTAVRRLGHGAVLRGRRREVGIGVGIGVGVVAATSVAVARPRRKMGVPVLSKDAMAMAGRRTDGTGMGRVTRNG